MRPVLVLNKLDRLATETIDAPDEAFSRLRRVVEAADAALFEAAKLHGVGGAWFKAARFEAGKGTVVFASASDGWGFSRADRAETPFLVAAARRPRAPRGLRQRECIF